jgi:hypothetical protein
MTVPRLLPLLHASACAGRAHGRALVEPQAKVVQLQDVHDLGAGALWRAVYVVCGYTRRQQVNAPTVVEMQHYVTVLWSGHSSNEELVEARTRACAALPRLSYARL